MKRVRLHKYGHKLPIFCSKACQIGFKEDRKNKLIYGPYYIKSLNRFAISAEEAANLLRFCPYCNQKEGQLI